jgi:hypothetical protein
MKNIIAAMLLLGTPLIASAGEKVIYGTDDRLDYFQAAPDMRKLADSVVSLWKVSDVTQAEDGKSFNLATANYGSTMNLCPEEPFREQPLGAFCSGTLVDKYLVITAGHCIKNADDCANTRFVFGFALKTPGEQPSSAQAADVYSCKRIIKQNLPPGLGADYALVELDRPAEGRTPLALSRSAALKKGDGVFVIGHPSGLPVKVAGGATVRDPSPAGYFVANLDTYGGNSGSAVFNARTRLIEGILVRGDNDFVYKDSCRVSNVVPADGGRGEDVTKISELASLIPKSADAGGVTDILTVETPAPPEPGRLEAILKALGFK